MKSVSNLETAVHREGVAVTRKVAVTNPIFALWHTQIGKKVVIAPRAGSSNVGAMPEEIQVDFALANHTYRFALADLFKKWSRDRQNPDSRRWPSAIATKLQRAAKQNLVRK
jgi:hypothetical protein